MRGDRRSLIALAQRFWISLQLEPGRAGRTNHDKDPETDQYTNRLHVQAPTFRAL